MNSLLIAFLIGSLLAVCSLIPYFYRRYKANKAFNKFESVTEEIKDLVSELKNEQPETKIKRRE